MKLSLRTCGIALFAGLLFVSCGKEKKVQFTSASLTILPPSEMRIAQICQSYVHGDFENIVNLMHCYKDLPRKFQSQLVNMMKQKAAERKSSEMEITGISPNQIVLQKGDKAANVFLDISYNNGQREEIILPLIYDKGNWWIK